MRSVLKACDLEDRFPILAVENNCIVSKDADITVAFEVELPELYTVTAAEYEAIHGTWVKAMKVLPNYSVVYKQDWFVKENYRSEGNGTESFLSRSYERHFNERPYLRHRCFLYLTKTTRERARRRSDFSTLCRGYILPKEITDWGFGREIPGGGGAVRAYHERFGACQDEASQNGRGGRNGRMSRAD